MMATLAADTLVEHVPAALEPATQVSYADAGVRQHYASPGGALIWQTAGASVRGAAHIRSGLPNQDALRCVAVNREGTTAMVAVADGHGSDKCFRSDLGAELAVESATNMLQRLVAAEVPVTNLESIAQAVEQIVVRWRSAVDADLRAAPFLSAELGALERRKGIDARRLVEVNPYLAYGTTLAAVVATASYILYVQLGDGDILAVDSAGQVTRPLEDDGRLFGGETTSLSGREAARDFRVGFQLLAAGEDEAPSLILLATDGYANSFRDDAGFVQVGSDLLGMIRAEGLDAVAGSLPDWLGEATHFGSGDDVTVGLLYGAWFAKDGSFAEATGAV